MPAARLWSKLRGTVENLFQVGLGGPGLKNNSSALEARNSGDTGYAIMRAAAPQENNDLVTKAYADQLAYKPSVAAQFDGNQKIPSNTSAQRWLVVTTTGASAAIGQLLWDDGSGTGQMQVASAAPRLILTTQAFTGGTVTFAADALYAWDVEGGAWVAAGGQQSSGAIREIRLPVSNAASQSSAAKIPANAVIVEAMLSIATPFSAGATIAVGQTGAPTLLMEATDSLPQIVGGYQSLQDTPWGSSALAVLVSVGGSPAAGAGFLLVKYALPDA